MPISLQDNWCLPGARSLQDLAMLPSKTRLDEFKNLKMGLEFYNCPPHLHDRFDHVVEKMYATNQFPRIMHPRAGAKFEGGLKLNVELFNILPIPILKDREPDFYNSNYTYLDEYLGRRRLNVVSQRFQCMRMDEYDSIVIEGGRSRTLTDGLHQIEWNLIGNSDIDYSCINLIQSPYSGFQRSHESLAISPELFASNVADYYRKPVTYHVYEDDVVLHSDARRSRARASLNGGYSRAGMRRRDAGEITDLYNGHSRSLLAGAEFWPV